MKIVVTGATGFVGRHVVAALLAAGHQVTATARSTAKAREMPWFGAVHFVECDLHRDFGPLLRAQPVPPVLIHLAWPGLPNYKQLFHLSENLPADLRFLDAALAAGVTQLVVAGTCLEYGMQSGPLSEDQETKPATPYGLAKDTLRRALELMQATRPFTLQWMRLFYLYGEGQKATSLLAQLDRAIDEGRRAFDMSPGDQLRDYLTVEAMAANFVRVVENPACGGIINCCSGRPVAVRDLVERRCAELGASIRLNRGHYPYLDYEPLAFWGVPAKLTALADVTRGQPRDTRGNS